MRIHNDKSKIETKCDGIYFIEGLKVGSELLKTALINNKNPNKTKCVGLSHNQVGGTSRVFIAQVGKANTWKIFINPEIIKLSGRVEKEYEGCMTFPGKVTEVKRCSKVVLSYQKRARNNHEGPMFETATFKGFNAKIIQHEMAHLEGKHIFSESK